jgi:two-component system, LytTR family, response regulator
VLIVDDESAMRTAYRSLFESEPDMEVVGEAGSGAEAVEAVGRLEPDLVLLDVELPEINGFEVVRRIGIERCPPVIFVTGDERRATEAFAVKAFDCLVKPFTDGRFRATLSRARQHLLRGQLHDLEERLTNILGEVQTARLYPHRLWIRSRGQVVVLNMDEIDWIEADAQYSLVHMAGGVHRLRESISRIEGRLDPSRFARIHRCAIVNLDRVAEVVSSGGSQSVSLNDGTRIPMSRSQKSRVFALAGTGS